MRNFNKTLSISLAFFLLWLSACSVNNSPSDMDGKGESITVSKKVSALWETRLLTLPENVGTPIHMEVYDNNVFFTAIPLDGGYSQLYCYNLENAACEELLGNDNQKIATGKIMQDNIDAFCVNQDGNILICSTRITEASSEFITEGVFISSYDNQGVLQSEKNITQDLLAYAEDSTIADFFISQIASVDELTMILFQQNQKEYLLAEKLSGTERSISLDNLYGSDMLSISLLSDNDTVYLASPGLNEIFLIDLETSTLQKFVNTEIVNKNYVGNTPILFWSSGQLYVLSDAGLSKIQTSDGSIIEIIDFLDNGIDINSPVGCDSYNDDFILMDCNENGVGRLRRISKKGTIESRDEITIGVLGVDSGLQDAVILFNKNNADIHVTIYDYNELNRDGNETLGTQALALDILEGNAPDIIDMATIPTVLSDNIKEYGLLTDLEPFINADSDISLDNYFSNIISMLRFKDQKLYAMVPSFSILTCIAHKNDVAALGKMTWKEIYQVYDKSKYTSPITGGSPVLLSSIAFDINDNYNYDSNAFQTFLQFVNGHYSEADADYTSFIDEKDMLSYVEFSGLGTFIPTLSSLGSNWQIVGYPGEDSGDAVIVPTAKYAISSQSEKQEIAWTFLKYILSSTTSIHCFSTNQAELNKAIELASVEAEDAQGMADVETYLIPIIPSEQSSTLLTLIENADKMWDYDENIFAIIEEEYNAYAQGNESVEKASQNIHSRVKIYMDEQR